MTPRTAKIATPNVVLATPVLGGTGGMGSTPMIMGHSDSSSGHGGQGVLMASSSSGAGLGGFNAVGRTPLRDQFGLNQTPQHEGMHGNSDTFSVSDAASVSGQSMMSSRYERERDRLNRAELKSRLQALPEPEYTYEIAVPEVPGQVHCLLHHVFFVSITIMHPSSFCRIHHIDHFSSILRHPSSNNTHRRTTTRT